MKMNKKVVACLGLGAAALIGGTFAFYSQTTSLDNPLSTGKYNTQLVEEFTPPTEDLKPGQKWDKKVGAENTGDYPVLVRVKMEEKWVRQNETDSYKTLSSTSNKNAFNVGKKPYSENEGFFADQNGVNGDIDGLVSDEDKTVVYKTLNVADGWVAGDDGYWYWNGVLNKGSKTTNLMNELVMATNIDLGEYKTKEYYAIATDAEDKNWVEFSTTGLTDLTNDGVIDIRDLAESKKDELAVDGKKLFRKSESKITDNKGYADSNYTLTVTSEFVQATTDAVKAAWCNSEESAYTALKTNVLTKVTEDGVQLK